MKLQHSLSSVALLLAAAQEDLASSPDAALELAALLRRAAPVAPDGYTPASVSCPSTRPSIRSALELSAEERAWLETRRNNTIDPMREFLTRMNITDFDVGGFFDDVGTDNATALPNVGIAVSGGGYRALMNGAGALAAFDARSGNSTGGGQLGGLLQSATYLSGLSGGGWLVGSMYVNNFTSVADILNTTPEQSGSLWQFQNSIFKGPDKGGFQVLDTAEYYTTIQRQVDGKATAGFNTSLTDYWGRALSFQLVNASAGGPAYTWSSIADDADFSDGNAPMPILVADGRAPGETLVSLNATVYEFTPWELGSFDPTVFGFAPLKYTGSAFEGGELPSSADCIEGFDNAAFVMGTSSSLFNTFILNLDQLGNVPQALRNVVENVLNDLGDDSNDIADWTPNPFFHFNNESNPNAESERLTLVDGGEDLQNIPLHPLIQPVRAVDVIFAVDSSADTEFNWPNGTAMVASYERSVLNRTMENGTAFPAVPDVNTFVNLGLNARPTFFGCDANNQSGPHPLIVYIPNHPYVAASNVSTFDPDYNHTQRNAIVENGYDVVTLANATVDPDWPACVGCAVLSRSLGRNGLDVPRVCSDCFDRYCWDGSTNDTDPGSFEPDFVLTEIQLAGAASARELGFMTGSDVTTV
ncbi:lysophospholipase [Lineolata rhizophorae]|uniref:Lysophospholipase n=1 Tax=Lineolata rhizophorae TaxID=578093 RepID=A0A6A6NQ72_9PEZI|nr:lysophospholipase [Lineolata rhizophorae]